MEIDLQIYHFTLYELLKMKQIKLLSSYEKGEKTYSCCIVLNNSETGLGVDNDKVW